jgi:segregation and condensation protein B
VQTTAVDSLIQERFRADGMGLDGPELDAAVEALLMVATEPTHPNDLAQALDVHPDEVLGAIARLEERTGRGWIVQRHGQTLQISTAPRFAEYVRRFLGIERESRLSAAALEALAVVAYRQPVTRAEIERVRGVDCTGVLATLLSRGLIDMVGRQDSPGNPMLYGTTSAFLNHFGLSSLDELPPLGDVNGEDAGEHLTDLIVSVQSESGEAASG